MRKGLYLFFAPIIFILWIIPGVFVSAQEETEPENLGLIPENIWFSKDPFFVDDEIEIYTFLFNCREERLRGYVEFWDHGETLIGKTDFSLPGGCSTEAISIEWTATRGPHSFSARVVDTTLLLSDGTEKEVNLGKTETGPTTRIVEHDIDGDNIPDSLDADIDGDGILNEEEEALGTDPENPDTDGDGIIDINDEEPTVFNVVEKTGIAKQIETIKEKTEDFLPDETRTIAEDIYKKVEDFRKEQKENVTILSGQIKKRIDEEKEPPPPDETSEEGGEESLAEDDGPRSIQDQSRSILRYVGYFSLQVLLYILDIKVLFYLVSALIVFFILRFIWKRIRRRMRGGDEDDY